MVKPVKETALISIEIQEYGLHATPSKDWSSIPLSIPDWTKTSFSNGIGISEKSFQSLLEKASEAAKNDFDVQSTIEWVAGYQFLRHYLENSNMCLKAAERNFVEMVR